MNKTEAWSPFIHYKNIYFRQIRLHFTFSRFTRNAIIFSIW